jgi:ribosomal protein S12 methylthiotransferase
MRSIYQSSAAPEKISAHSAHYLLEQSRYGNPSQSRTIRREKPATITLERVPATITIPEVAAVPTTANPVTPVKVGFVSLGCPKNLVDSEVMMGLLQRAGATLTTDAANADVLVVNTCSFIDSAQQESVNTILEMAKHKTAGRATRLVVAGCLVERYRDDIRAQIPEVDAVVGTGELSEILAAAGLTTTIAAPETAPSPFNILTGKRPEAETDIVASRREGDLREQQGRFSRGEWQGATSALPTYLYDDTTPRLLTTPRASAYIKIAEGCDHPCSFCIIPQLRGKFRSRRFESVIAEAEQLVASGVREITLVGQDTTCYGEDLGLKEGLPLLLDRLAQIPDLKWLRFLYAYPNRVSDRLLDVMAAHENICSYLDVPLQHASPNVLKSMKRGAGADIFLRTLDRVRHKVPNVALRTSFIVGFPGETDADFDILSRFVEQAEFDWLGVFQYSDEEGSNAHNLGAKVPLHARRRRERRLMELQQSISRRKKQQLLGRRMDILVEGESEDTPLLWEGRTAMHAPEIDGKVYINDFGPHETLTSGQFHTCEVVEAHDYDLVVRILD